MAEWDAVAPTHEHGAKMAGNQSVGGRSPGGWYSA